jgi:glycosyltransferase involved in cell wall biosynthesis
VALLFLDCPLVHGGTAVRVALVSYNARSGDAIGNQVAEKLSFFLDGGADVRVFVESDQGLHPQVRPHCRLLAPEPRGEGWKFLRKCDLVVVDYSQAYALLGLLPLLASERPRVILDYHGVTPPELWGGHNVEALTDGQRWRGLVGFADAALVHSRSSRRELLTPTRFPAERTTSLGLPLDTSFWQPGPPTRDLREPLGIDADARILLFVGRLAKNKRVPLLAELLHRLGEQAPPVHAVVIGDNSDVYELEATACKALAAELDVADRLHILGRVPVRDLRDAYRSADVFVMPSRHEGFCIPVIEAMACGLPVVAARAAALPETVADAGLTFIPDDVDDFARRVQRVLDRSSAEPRPLRSVAIVAPRYSEELVGGAERSLRTIAQTLRAAGVAVEIFTTCARREGRWANDVPEGTGMVGGLPVHRFFLDGTNLRSPRLLDALSARAGDFDRIVVGPYLFDLTRDVARAFADKAILLPCFHDEPAARVPACRELFEGVAGILYHSEEERHFAQGEIGLNHPGAHLTGTHIDAETQGNAERGRAMVGSSRYVVYCGRYIAEKGLPLLLEFARDHGAVHPNGFTFVFMGEGNVEIPRVPWAVNLGFVSESAKRDVLAGATALIQPSERESLSLVCLEAWAQGVPVIGQAGCEVFRGHIRRGAGGRTFHDAATFAAVLDELWQHPEIGVELGRRGQEYVRHHYGSADAYRDRLRKALADDGRILAERLRERGIERARDFDRAAWRCAFAVFVEETLDAPVRPVREQIEITARGDQRTVSVALSSTLIPVRITNHGTHPVVAHGPARYVLRSYVGGDTERPWRVGGPEVPLPGLLLPGESVAATMPVSVSSEPGIYRVSFRAHRAGTEETQEAPPADPLATTIEVHVTADARRDEDVCAPLLDQVRLALTHAHGLQRLPDDYAEVGHGALGRFKRWLKAKLLGRFKRAYVDVLSRQQSEFNRQMMTAVQELSECCETLDHARGQTPRASSAGEDAATAEVLRHLVRHLTEQLCETRQEFVRLQERVAQLESGRNKRRDVA